MARVIHYFAHPGVRFSHTNKDMWHAAQAVDGVTKVDLYHEYPRKYLDVPTEQQRLLDHDVILLQFPVFWYSCPSLVKEWIDLTFERGFAYGHEGDKLAGKTLMLALTTGGSDEAYTASGYQGHTLRTFFTPFEQTAKLCRMRYPAPYVKYSALSSEHDAHVAGFVTLLEALRDDRFDIDAACSADVLHHDSLPIMKEV